MKHTKIFLIAALLGTVLASCQKEEEINNTPDEQPEALTGWTLKVNATKVVDTKAMSLDGTTLNAYWKNGETVGVYFDGAKIGTLTAGDITNGGQNAVLSGEMNTIEGLAVNSKIMLLYPDKSEWSYLGQDGTAPTESGSMNGFDYATATLTVSNVNSTTKVITVSSAASFKNQQSVYRFGFKTGGSAFNVKSFSITSSQNKLVRTRTIAAGNEWASSFGSLSMEPTTSESIYYMAIRNENTAADVYTFTVVRGSDNAVLEGTKSIPAGALAAPTFLNATVNVNQKVMASAPSGEIATETDVL